MGQRASISVKTRLHDQRKRKRLRVQLSTKERQVLFLKLQRAAV
jgi:hypothetical protein